MSRTRRYAKYRDARSSWLEVIPTHWTVSRFGYEVVINGGQIDPRKPPWLDMTLVAPNHIESGTGRLLGRETAREQGADSGKYTVAAGQIIYSKIRPALNKATVAVEDCLCSADMYALALRQRVDRNYALYQILSGPFHQFASVTSGRVKMPKINREELSGAPWLVPPLDEQRVIAAYLDREINQIDGLIAKQERLIETLGERRAAVVERVTTHGSQTWPIDKLGRWTRIGNGSTPRREQADFWEGGELPWLNSAVANRSTVDSAEQFVTPVALRQCHLPIVEPGSLLVGLTGQGKTRGMATLLMFRATVSQHLAYVTPEKVWHAPYLLWALRASYRYLRLLSDENGSTKGGLTCEDLKGLRLARPPLDEQRRIANYVDEQTGKIETLISRAERFITLAKERRSALITAAVTGQIDVRSHALEPEEVEPA